MTKSFDYEKFLNMVEGDENLVKELIQLFLGDYPAQLKLLEEAAKTKDADKLRNLAHSLKGGLGYFAAEPARLAAEKLEQLGKDKNFELVPAYLQKLESELKCFTEELRELLGSLENKEK